MDGGGPGHSVVTEEARTIGVDGEEPITKDG